MAEELRLRNLPETTSDTYLRAVARFAKHFGKPPEQFRRARGGGGNETPKLREFRGQYPNYGASITEAVDERRRSIPGFHDRATVRVVFGYSYFPTSTNGAQ